MNTLTVKEKWLLSLSGIPVIGLFFYSFTQIDLGLVITRIPWLYVIEQQFQYIGYFNRPLSTLFYVILMLSLAVLYFSLLSLLKNQKVSPRFFWSLLGIISVVLFFSYNAFSYDLFNYIFDAKILTHYGQNPYVHKALDYPGDPMLGFMHWTHRTYPLVGERILAVGAIVSVIGVVPFGNGWPINCLTIFTSVWSMYPSPSVSSIRQLGQLAGGV